MARRKNQARFPATLLDDIMWTFWGEPFADRSAFDAAVREENGPEWFSDQHLHQIVLRAPRVRIVPDVWDWDQDDPVLELTPDNGEAFTAGEILFKIHNAWVAVLRELDHKFFEGLTLKEQPKTGMPPVYELNQGS